MEGQEYIREIVRERKINPGKDIISLMANAKDKDGNNVMTIEEVAIHAAEIAFAGHDTTAQLIGNAVKFLSENPEQFEKVKAKPELWANVVEETLRRRPTAPFTGRKAINDIEIGGVTIGKGDMVFFSLASAQHDPDHYENPEKFDIERPKPSDHIAFGLGAHACPGGPLGRLQGRIGLEVLYERLPDINVSKDNNPIDFEPMVIVLKRRSLLCEWTPQKK